jgi:RecA-family ATPase
MLGWRKPPEQTKKPPFKYFLLGSIAALPEPHDFVEGLLCDGQMSVIFGDTNVGKSFFALDLALRMALGWRWAGRAVDQGGVVYIAGEGAGGLRRRVNAFLSHHGIADVSGIPFALIPEMVNFRDERSIEGLIRTIREISAQIASPIRWIIVDTLSRALAGGNENAPDDMGAAIRGADRVRSATGAHLSFVHHTGKDETKGARGHSALKAAIDTELEIRRVEGAKGAINVTVTKQRDLEIGLPLAFQLVSVDLGTNKCGKSM